MQIEMQIELNKERFDQGSLLLVIRGQVVSGK